LNIHTGKTKKWRVESEPPIDPTPSSGDLYIDKTSGKEAIGIYCVNGWVYISLAK